MTKTSGQSVAKTSGQSVAKTSGQSVAKTSDIFKKIDPIDKNILQLKYMIHLYTITKGETPEEQKQIDDKKANFELELSDLMLTKQMDNMRMDAGSRKRKTGTKKRAARKGKRKSNRNKK
jgi:hypothetical protein